MKHRVTYRIVERSMVGSTGQRWFEVWGQNPATGYEWLIAEYDTRDAARIMIRHWQETAA